MKYSGHVVTVLDYLVSLGPFFLFIIAMVVVWLRGTRQNKEILTQLEDTIQESLDPFVQDMKKVQIKPDEYEFRCKTTNKDVRILTLHLKLVNRSFLIQWLINLLFKEKERVFMGVKIGGQYGDEDPVYKFDIVPYHRKSFIRQRFEQFVEYDDIPTIDKDVDNDFMIKSEDLAYVKHFVENPEFVRLTKMSEPYMEHLGLQKANEDTDPHISVTFEFDGSQENPIDTFVKLFFTTVNLHLQNHEDVKKIISRGKRGRAKARSRGRAKRGAAKRTGRRRQKKSSSS